MGQLATLVVGHGFPGGTAVMRRHDNRAAGTESKPERVKIFSGPAYWRDSYRSVARWRPTTGALRILSESRDSVRLTWIHRTTVAVWLARGSKGREHLKAAASGGRCDVRDAIRVRPRPRRRGGSVDDRLTACRQTRCATVTAVMSRGRGVSGPQQADLEATQTLERRCELLRPRPLLRQVQHYRAG